MTAFGAFESIRFQNDVQNRNWLKLEQITNWLTGKTPHQYNSHSVWLAMHVRWCEIKLPRFVLVNRTGGAGGLSSSLDIFYFEEKKNSFTWRRGNVSPQMNSTATQLQRSVRKQQRKKIDFQHRFFSRQFNSIQRTMFRRISGMKWNFFVKSAQHYTDNYIFNATEMEAKKKPRKKTIYRLAIYLYS